MIVKREVVKAGVFREGSLAATHVQPCPTLSVQWPAESGADVQAAVVSALAAGFGALCRRGREW